MSENNQEINEQGQNFAEKSLAELSELFESLKNSAEAMARSKEADALKSAFYKLLGKLKAESPESGDESGDGGPFAAVEENFKALYSEYKQLRAEYNREQDSMKEENLKAKQAVIEDLRALLEKQEDVNATFPEFREIQARWRAIGPVPANAFRELNETYQYNVERFYDMVRINRDLRDLDFRKNLEAKTAFCEAAEKLAEDENVVNAFFELQKLHEQWKELGPVAREFRDDIWNRFKSATAVINKKYQSHFEEMKQQQVKNLEDKTALCEKLEAIADRSEAEELSSEQWNALTKEIEELQGEWRKIGFATKKDNQKIYDRFRAACDKFFLKKKEYYSKFKDDLNENLSRKMSIIEQAEKLKESKEWKKATDQFIALQKQWKEIGAVPRKKSEQIWKRFRAACDEFFETRDKESKPENNFYLNLKAKKAVIDEINAFVPAEDAAANEAAMQDFAKRFAEIGFVPFKDKEKIATAYRDAMKAKFPGFTEAPAARSQKKEARPANARQSLVQQYNALQQQISTYENNIGFFSSSKNGEAIIAQMKQRIEDARKELKELEEKIRKAGEEQDNG